MHLQVPQPSSKVKVKVLVASVVSDSSQPMDCSLQGSSVYENFQARTLAWVFFSRGSSWPKDQTQVSFIGRRVLYCPSYQVSLELDLQRWWAAGPRTPLQVSWSQQPHPGLLIQGQASSLNEGGESCSTFSRAELVQNSLKPYINTTQN